MREGLRALGVRIEVERRGLAGGRARRPAARRRPPPLDVRASGTTARFLAAAALPGRWPGRDRRHPAHARAPDPRRGRGPAGARRRCRGAGGERLPAAAPRGRRPARAARPRSTPAARASTSRPILLVAPCAARDVTLHLADGVLVSRPFVDLTLEVMRDFGAEADCDGRRDPGARGPGLRGPLLPHRGRLPGRRLRLRGSGHRGGPRARSTGVPAGLAADRPRRSRRARAHGLPDRSASRRRRRSPAPTTACAASTWT